jgi:hypothetical protein
VRLNYSNAPEAKVAYQAKLDAMSDNELFAETKDNIWGSAYAANNPVSCFHWERDYTRAEWQRRGNAAQYGNAQTALRNSL